jgi:hypothetical protein
MNQQMMISHNKIKQVIAAANPPSGRNARTPAPMSDEVPTM